MRLLSKYRLTALDAYLILRWKRLGLANTLAYYDKELITTVKVFIAQSSGVDLIFFKV